MAWIRWTSLLTAAALLSSCGGGGGSGGTTAVAPAPAPSPTPTPAPTGTCALSSRQQWADAAIREWYLFPETLPASLNGGDYATLTAYIDALTATARAQGRDRFFTYVTSIAEENAFFNSGASAGFGIRLQYDTAARRVFIVEVFENAPAGSAGLVRGDEITAIGTSPGDLRSVSDIMAADGTAGITTALGPSTAGTARTLQLTGTGGNRTLSITKADYSLTPVSPDYGTRVIEQNGVKVGYVNLRTFISSADQQLITAFSLLKAQGVRNLIIDLRYNGGGLVATAELLSDLLGGDRFTSDVQAVTTYRPEKASNNTTRRFQPRSASIAPLKLAFITTRASASASEFVINAMLPYLGNNVAMVGANSFGKPVGQIAIDRSACDDRLRVVAFSTRNSAGSDNYYSGLASVVPNTCQAADDYTQPLGSAAESSVRTALDFIAGRSCTPIPTGQTGQSLAAGRALLQPAAPTAAQRETPGLF